ncbi:unnamed protein product [Phytomonas sp. EM1]|nr:unnamed protein product [Phytomonas sp. EM1]|eukprot:CCW61380.1 unnamed protein product [Phytomonas sp. isolate EM1]
MKKQVWILVALLLHTILCLIPGNVLEALAVDPLELWSLHAANLYVLQPTVSNEARDLTPLNSADQLITSNCTFPDVYTEGSRQSENSKALRDAMVLVNLSSFLQPSIPIDIFDGPHTPRGMGSRVRTDAKKNAEGPPSSTSDVGAFLTKPFLLSGRLHTGPFWGRKTPEDPPNTQKSLDDETNRIARISVFAGETTGKLCFDLSLYDAEADFRTLAGALHTWVSPHCSMRLDDFLTEALDPSLFASPEVLFEEISREGGARDPTGSPWWAACELASVSRFDFDFPLAIKTKEKGGGLCEEVEASLSKGRQRELRCGFRLVVRFRPALRSLSEREKAEAVLKIAAVVSMPPRKINQELNDSLIRQFSPSEGNFSPDSPSSAPAGGGEAARLRRCSSLALSDQFWNLTGSSCTPSLRVSYRVKAEVLEDDGTGKTQLYLVLIFCCWLSLISYLCAQFIASMYSRVELT